MRFREAFGESVRSAYITAAITIIVWVIVFSCLVGRKIYSDHVWAVARIEQFQNIPKPTCAICPTCSKSITTFESKTSLRRRTLRIVKELNEFWSQRPTPEQQPVQNASTDEDRKRNAAWDQYWRDAKAAYLNADYRHRLVGIVREYKNKGIDTGYLEQVLDQPERLVGAVPFGGFQLDNCFQSMNVNELCQIRELAYHIDANDQPIFLVANQQE